MKQWDDLRYFLAVSRQRSLSGAARELGVNHATVFRRINSLEEDLGLALFARLPSGYVLTQGGEELLDYAERIEQEVFAFERRVTGSELHLRGTLRLTTVDTVVHYALMPHLRTFSERYPQILLEVVTDNRFFSLTKREADLAIRPTTRPEDNVVARKLLGVAVAVYGAREYLARHEAPGAPGDLRGHRIVRGDDSLSHLPAEAWMSRQVAEEQVVLRTNNLMNQLAAVRAGLGLTMLPCFMGDLEPELVRVLPPEPSLSGQIWLVYHPDLRHTARVRAFADFIVEAFQADRPLFEGERPREAAAGAA
jgi:DNA-binding transcriptional LysR family regulator